MKKLLALLVCVLCVLFMRSAFAVTVYYQPTPYPLLKSDGSPMPQDLKVVHSWGGNLYYCSWCNNNAGITYFSRSDRLQTGGWGDDYDPYMRFDLTGLPTDASYAAVYFMPFSIGGASTSTPLAFCSNDSEWNLSMVWSSQPLRSCYGYFAAPTPGSWYGFIITSWYNGWRNGTKFNGGVSMFPQNINNNFDAFRSPAYADYVNDPYAGDRRPLLLLEFVPTLDLKIPLPGGYAWLLTNEIGGYECTGAFPWPDVAHQDSVDSVNPSNYYSLDFVASGSGYPTSTPILAAAGGKVLEVNTTDVNHPNGYYVVVDHDSDGSPNTGFQTRYLHLASPPSRKNGTLLAVGNPIQQGDQIGFMGSTGVGTGTHLHFGVRYKNDSKSTTPELTKVVMEGLLLKSYQTECSVDSVGKPTGWIRRYSSTLVPTGN